MLNLLKYGLGAAILCVSVQSVQAQTIKGEPRDEINFNTRTGCAKMELDPGIGYNIDMQEKDLFLFLRLGPFGAIKAGTLASLKSWSGRPITLERYDKSSDVIVYQKLDKDVYVLNVMARTEVLACQSKQNGMTQPEIRMPNPESVPGYVELKAPNYATPDPVSEVEVSDGEDVEIHIPDYYEAIPVEAQQCFSTTTRTTAFVIKSTKDNQYIIVRSVGPQSTADEGNNRKWENRPPRLLPAHGDVSDIIEMTEHDKDFAMAQLKKKGNYWLFFDAHIYGDVLGDVDVCIGSRSILNRANNLPKRR